MSQNIVPSIVKFTASNERRMQLFGKFWLGLCAHCIDSTVCWVCNFPGLLILVNHVWTLLSDASSFNNMCNKLYSQFIWRLRKLQFGFCVIRVVLKAKFLTWCTSKVGFVPHTPKSGDGVRTPFVPWDYSYGHGWTTRHMWKSVTTFI